MTYRIRPGETFAPGIRRVLREELDQALGSARVASDSPHRSIHDIRKRLKKIRGALRLVRLHLPGDAFDEENAHHRDTGRLLAEAREAQVAPETLEWIVDEAGEFEDDAPLLDQARERLTERRGTLHERAVRPGETMDRVRERLLEARERLPSLPLRSLDADALARGVWKVYKRGVRRRVEAYEGGGPPVFHQWRKRAKYLWYHLRLLTSVWPPVLEPWAREQHELTDRLGRANDLADLEAAVAADAELLPAGPARQRLLDASSRLRVRCWEEARPLGERLYAESPEALESRVRRYIVAQWGVA